jgi:hypothetical protein
LIPSSTNGHRICRILKILAVISSIVIGAVSIAPFITIVNSLIITIIIIGIFAAIANYLFLSFWKFFGNRALNHIDIAFFKTIEILNIIDGFVAAGSFDLDVLTARQLYIMGQFVKIVGTNSCRYPRKICKNLKTFHLICPLL